MSNQINECLSCGKKGDFITYLTSSDASSHSFCPDCCRVVWDVNKDGNVISITFDIVQHYLDREDRKRLSRELADASKHVVVKRAVY